MVRTEVGEDTKASFRWYERRPLPAPDPSAVEIPPDLARLRFHAELHQFHDADWLELHATATDNRKRMRSAPGDLFGLEEGSARRPGAERHDPLLAQSYSRTLGPTRGPKLEEQLRCETTHVL